MQLFTGLEYIKIDVANKFGINNLNWDERIKWFNDNEPNLENMIDLAEEPASFYASLKSFHIASMGGAVGYPISLDATSSGAQVLSALTRDYKASKLCNVVDTGSRENLYTNIHKKVGGTASYEKTKKAIMTSLYNSKEQPKTAFGDNYELFCDVMNKEMPRVWMLTSIMLDLWDENAYEYNWTLPDGFSVNHKVMDNEWDQVQFKGSYYSFYTYVNKPIKRGKYGSRSLLANITHSLDGYINREMCRRAMYDRKQLIRVEETLLRAPKNSNPTGREADTLKRLWSFYTDVGILSARILDYVNPYTVSIITEPKVAIKLINSFPQKPFNILSIHDMFRVHPNYGNDVRKLYNTLLAEINESQLFNYFMTILTKQIQSFDLGDSFGDEIRQANYALS